MLFACHVRVKKELSKGNNCAYFIRKLPILFLVAQLARRIEAWAKNDNSFSIWWSICIIYSRAKVALTFVSALYSMFGWCPCKYIKCGFVVNIIVGIVINLWFYYNAGVCHITTLFELCIILHLNSSSLYFDPHDEDDHQQN